jgi:hypothetical protein
MQRTYQVIAFNGDTIEEAKLKLENTISALLNSPDYYLVGGVYFTIFGEGKFWASQAVIHEPIDSEK